MKKDEKTTYVIIALICLIVLNLGSMVIVLGKNTSNIRGDRPAFIVKVKSALNIGNFLRDTIGKSMAIDNLGFDKDKNKGLFKENNDKPGLEDEFEIVDDYMFLEEIDELENLIIVKDSKGKHMIENIPELLKVKELNYNKEKPYIYIYHTHATEAFGELRDSNFRSKDDSKNIVSMGSIVSKVLEAGGHKLIHNRTQHDNPSYSKSYSRSLNSIKSAMEEEKNLKIILDLHRDARDPKKEDYEKARAKTLTKIDGKDVAKFSLVVGAESANYKEVLSFAKYIKAVSDIVYPDLCSDIIIKKYGRFNQYVSDYAALVEVGFNINTYDEVSETAKLIGEILDIAIRGISKD